MMNWNKRNHLKTTVAGLGLMMLTACNGIFDDIYDKPEEIVPAKGQIVMDATIVQPQPPCLYPAPKERQLCGVAVGKLSLAEWQEVLSHHKLQISVLIPVSGIDTVYNTLS